MKGAKLFSAIFMLIDFWIQILFFYSMEEKEKYGIRDKSRNKSSSKEAYTLHFIWCLRCGYTVQLQVADVSTRCNADTSCSNLSATIAAACLAKKIGLHGRLDGERFHATCTATPLQDKLQRKLHRVSAPLLTSSPRIKINYHKYWAKRIASVLRNL
jgi:predicted ferric reductase